MQALGEEVPALIQDQASWKPHPAPNEWALCRLTSLPPFLLLSHPQEERQAALVGQEGEVLWGRCGEGATPLAGIWGTHSGAGTSLIPSSTADQLLSKGPVPTPAGLAQWLEGQPVD